MVVSRGGSKEIDRDSESMEMPYSSGVEWTVRSGLHGTPGVGSRIDSREISSGATEKNYTEFEWRRVIGIQKVRGMTRLWDMKSQSELKVTCNALYWRWFRG
eukprot:Gb_29300 [translate_table: standard]